MNYDGACKFFYKKNSLKGNVFIEIIKNCLLLFFDVIIETNKFFIFSCLLNFTMKCIGGQIKAFSFLFCTPYDAKCAKRWRVLIYRVIAKQRAKREQIHPVCLHAVKKYEKVEIANTQNDYKTTSKKGTGKKKRNLFCEFFKCLNFKKTNSRLFKRISWK